MSKQLLFPFYKQARKRLSNITTVAQLASGDFGDPNQIVSFAQDIHSLCVKHGVGGGAVGMPW